MHTGSAHYDGDHDHTPATGSPGVGHWRSKRKKNNRIPRTKPASFLFPPYTSRLLVFENSFRNRISWWSDFDYTHKSSINHPYKMDVLYRLRILARIVILCTLIYCVMDIKNVYSATTWPEWALGWPPQRGVTWHIHQLWSVDKYLTAAQIVTRNRHIPHQTSRCGP